MLESSAPVLELTRKSCDEIGDNHQDDQARKPQLATSKSRAQKNDSELMGVFVSSTQNDKLTLRLCQVV
jgi:hypothetical protein